MQIWISFIFSKYFSEEKCDLLKTEVTVLPVAVQNEPVIDQVFVDTGECEESNGDDTLLDDYSEEAELRRQYEYFLFRELNGRVLLLFNWCVIYYYSSINTYEHQKLFTTHFLMYVMYVYAKQLFLSFKVRQFETFVFQSSHSVYMCVSVVHSKTCW